MEDNKVLIYAGNNGKTQIDVRSKMASLQKTQLF